MSIASELTALATNKANIKAAIVAKNPATAPTDALSQWPTAIASIPTGSPEKCWLGGPDVPQWKDDGHTWIWIDLSRAIPGYERKCAFHLRPLANNAVTIDWGDGTSTTNQTYAEWGDILFEHTYTDETLTIVALKITVASGAQVGIGYGDPWNRGAAAHPIFALEVGQLTSINQSHGGSGLTIDTGVGVFSNYNPCVLRLGANTTFAGINASGVQYVFWGEGARLKNLSYADRGVAIKDFAGKSFDTSRIDQANTKSMAQTFQGCGSIDKIDLSTWDTSSVTTLLSTFQSCSSLIYVDISTWDTKKVTNMNSTFLYCRALKYIDISSWELPLVTSMTNTFIGCSSLENIIGNKTIAADGSIGGSSAYFGKGPGVSFSLTDCPLDHDSLLFLMYWIADKTGATASTLTLGSTKLAKLSSDEKAVATAKNWTLA